MSYPVSKSRFKKPRKARGERNFKPFRPQLTSLVDVMTILLIYLLQSFSAEGDIVTVSKDLMLPESSAKRTPELTVVLTVTRMHIMAEDTRVADVNEVLGSDDMVIPGLYQWLGNRRAMTERIGEYSTKTRFEGNISIQGDKRIRFRLLKKIMYTCGQQGYNNFLLMVQKKG